MNLKHTSGSDDDTLTRCEEFGGEAEACAKIAECLDEKITEKDEEIGSLESLIGTLEERIAELERTVADLEEAARLGG